LARREAGASLAAFPSWSLGTRSRSKSLGAADTPKHVETLWAGQHAPSGEDRVVVQDAIPLKAWERYKFFYFNQRKM